MLRTNVYIILSANSLSRRGSLERLRRYINGTFMYQSRNLYTAAPSLTEKRQTNKIKVEDAINEKLIRDVAKTCNKNARNVKRDKQTQTYYVTVHQKT